MTIATTHKNHAAIQDLIRLIDYNHETGKMLWRSRGPEWFKNNGQAERWNKIFANKPALATVTKLGYLQGDIWALGLRSVKAHRVAYAIAFGSWPIGVIDHINGTRADNSAKNLRDVTCEQNSKNRKRHCNNISGTMGVQGRSGVWVASCSADGHRIHLGTFSDAESAVAARKAAEARFGYSENHGRVHE